MGNAIFIPHIHFSGKKEARNVSRVFCFRLFQLLVLKYFPTIKLSIFLKDYVSQEIISLLYGNRKKAVFVVDIFFDTGTDSKILISILNIYQSKISIQNDIDPKLIVSWIPSPKTNHHLFFSSSISMRLKILLIRP